MLEVTKNNTPLYEQPNLSSAEIATLKKGEKLVNLSSNGLWYRVFYMVGGKYGYVLNFNVQSSQ